MADRLGPPSDSAAGYLGGAHQIVSLFPQAPAAAGAPATIIRESRDIAEDPDKALFVFCNPTGPHARRFRALRHRLAEQNNPRTILVTSAARGEGKSAVAANLALVLAESRHQRVLLVEANAQRPSLAALFKIPDAAKCFLEQLARPADDLSWRVQTLAPTELGLLPITSRAETNLSISPAAFRTAMARLRGVFDYVIVDGPAVEDGPALVALEDATETFVFVARSGVTQGRKLRAALEQVSPGRVAGLVITGRDQGQHTAAGGGGRQ